jgi:hypothetical protein
MKKGRGMGKAPVDVEHVEVVDDPRCWSDKKKNAVLACVFSILLFPFSPSPSSLVLPAVPPPFATPQKCLVLTLTHSPPTASSRSPRELIFRFLLFFPFYLLLPFSNEPDALSPNRIGGTISGSIFFPALESLQRDLQASDSLIACGVSLFILGQGAFPMCWSAISEVSGRKYCYLASLSAFVLLPPLTSSVLPFSLLPFFPPSLRPFIPCSSRRSPLSFYSDLHRRFGRLLSVHLHRRFPRHANPSVPGFFRSSCVGSWYSRRHVRRESDSASLSLA